MQAVEKVLPLIVTKGESVEDGGSTRAPSVAFKERLSTSNRDSFMIFNHTTLSVKACNGAVKDFVLLLLTLVVSMVHSVMISSDGICCLCTMWPLVW